jgi:ABC-type Fe3+/spermidine/putrescine transport system ATPase subunit
MNRGEIVQVGLAEEVVHKPNSAFVADFFGVENLFKGEIVRCGSAISSAEEGYNAIFKSGALQLSVIAEREGPAYAAIRPEDIVVSRELAHSSAMNNLSGIIVAIEATGPLVRLTANVGVRLVVLLTRQSLVALKLDLQVKAYFSFKAAAIHIF